MGCLFVGYNDNVVIFVVVMADFLIVPSESSENEKLYQNVMTTTKNQHKLRL